MVNNSLAPLVGELNKRMTVLEEFVAKGFGWKNPVDHRDPVAPKLHFHGCQVKFDCTAEVKHVTFDNATIRLTKSIVH